MGLAKQQKSLLKRRLKWLRGMDLNKRPLGYEPNELPDCSTPRRLMFSLSYRKRKGSQRRGWFCYILLQLGGFA